MSTVEYDAEAMRCALTELSGIARQLHAELRTLERVAKVRCPGGAPSTQRRHQAFVREMRRLRGRHRDFATVVQGAIEALILVDRQYNNGELVRELGLAEGE